MKRFLVLFTGVFALLQLTQCKTPAVVQAPVVPVADTPVATGGLHNHLDSFSYAVGMSIALQYKEFGVTSLNSTACMEAVNDIVNNKQPLFSPDEANMILNGYINKLMMEKAAINKHAGDSFLANNRTKPNIKILQSGVQYEVIKEGSGRPPALRDTVTVHYTGTLLDGTIFDSSKDRGAPETFTVDGVIKGWTEILQLMRVGSRFKVYIPAELAYGNYSPPGSNIPPGSLLIFDMELLSIGSR